MPLPAPRTWTNGEEPDNIPTADALNLDWRDSFDFLLGYSKPMINLEQSTSQNLVANTFLSMNWQVELFKRGGITHAANSNTIVVPYSGQYLGYCQIGFSSITAGSSRTVAIVQVNGTGKLRFDQSPMTTTSHEISGSMTLDINAGDSIDVVVRNTTTATTSTATNNRSKFVLWYAGEYQ
jgi:hypothetical protein